MKLIVRVANKLFRMHLGKERPVMFNIEETFPALLNIDKNADVIKQELLNVLSDRQNIPRYHDLDSNQNYISGSDSKNWRIFLLYAMGMKPKKNRDLCPETAALLDEIPNLFQAMFSILEPGKSVPAHHGGYYGILRYHLGLVIPKANPPSIRVNDIRYTWKDKESILFDDTWDHEVYNDSDEMRVVLMIDVLRPMPFYLHIINYCVSYVLVYIKHARKAADKVENYKAQRAT